jgi:replicative DNA helicase
MSLYAIHNQQAEQAVLGACLAAQGAPLAQIAFLVPQDLYVPVHRDIYSAMRHIYRNRVFVKNPISQTLSPRV